MGLMDKATTATTYSTVPLLGNWYVRQYRLGQYFYLYSYDPETETVAWTFDHSSAQAMGYETAQDILSHLKGE